MNDNVMNENSRFLEWASCNKLTDSKEMQTHIQVYYFVGKFYLKTSSVKILRRTIFIIRNPKVFLVYTKKTHLRSAYILAEKKLLMK